MVLESLLGALTGIAGNVATAVVNYRVQKLKNEHDLAMGRLELQRLAAEKAYLAAEAEAGLKLASVKADAEVELADSRAFLKAIEASSTPGMPPGLLERMWAAGGLQAAVAAAVSGLLGLVDFLKGLMRPALTAYLAAATTWITWMAWQVMQRAGAGLSAPAAAGLFSEVTSIVTYLTVSCVTWWFGDRRTAKFLMRLNKGKSGL